jgi:hypothetical protein
MVLRLFGYGSPPLAGGLAVCFVAALFVLSKPPSPCDSYVDLPSDYFTGGDGTASPFAISFVFLSPSQ